MMRSGILAVLFGLAWMGCESTGADAPCDPEVEDCEAVAALCQAAAERLAICVGVFAEETGEDCDPVDAQRVIDSDCDSLRAAFDDPEEQGGLSGIACDLGFYAACVEPSCVPLPGIEPPADDAPCSAWARYPGCGACAYYACRERQARCGPDGYLAGYVGPYCTRFATITERRVSPEATAWLGRVRRCLITYLDEQVPRDASCEEIDRRGTDSHRACYLDAGFCDLSVSDWFAIVHTIDVGDVPLRLVLTTGQGCLREWLGLDDEAP